MFNDYQGSLNCWLDYVTQYRKQQIEKRLYERYTANFIGKIAGAEKSYDDVLQKLDNLYNRKKERRLHREQRYRFCILSLFFQASRLDPWRVYRLRLCRALLLPRVLPSARLGLGRDL